MPTQAQNDAMRLYADLMEEIKHRIAAIDYCTMGNFHVPAPFVKDFCYLQLRMICELIALSCLVAHGDIKELNSMHKEWSLEKIMKTLEQLHLHFYPRPIRATIAPGNVHLQAIESRLPKPELLDLYRKCGDATHRGNLKKILKGQFPTQVHFPDITAHAQKVLDLLAHHVIVTKGGEVMFICMLRNPGDNNKVQVAIAETPKGQPMDYASPDFLRDPPSTT